MTLANHVDASLIENREHGLEEFHQEIMIMWSLRHPNIVQLVRRVPTCHRNQIVRHGPLPLGPQQPGQFHRCDRSQHCRTGCQGNAGYSSQRCHPQGCQVSQRSRPVRKRPRQVHLRHLRLWHCADHQGSQARESEVLQRQWAFTKVCLT